MSLISRWHWWFGFQTFNIVWLSSYSVNSLGVTSWGWILFKCRIIRPTVIGLVYIIGSVLLCMWLAVSTLLYWCSETFTVTDIRCLNAKIQCNEKHATWVSQPWPHIRSSLILFPGIVWENAVKSINLGEKSLSGYSHANSLSVSMQYNMSQTN